MIYEKEYIMKRLISLGILLFVIASAIVTVGASEAPLLRTTESQEIILGDADGDGAVTILDVTRIQRHLVQHNPSIEEANMKSAIVSGEDALSIVDATLIQRFLAGIIERFPLEETARPTEGESTEMKMLINNTPVTVEWEDNEAVEALKEAVKENPLVIHMSMYGGFEQVGSLGMSLPRNDTRITTSPGDVILYSGNQMVVFYGSNTWAYTRLGHITDQTQQELKQLLSNGNVTITLSEQKERR